MNLEKVNLTVLSEDNNTNDFIYVSANLSVRPSRLTLIGDFEIGSFLSVLDAKNPILINTIREIMVGTDDGIDETNNDVINSRFFVKLDNEVYVSYLLLNTESEEALVTNVTFLFNEISINEVEELVVKFDVYVPGDFDLSDDNDEDIVIAYTMTLDDGVIKLDPFVDASNSFGNISFYYNNDVMDQALDGIKQINELNKGILVIAGERGVGKTNLVKYIVSNIDFSKKVVYVPVQLFEVFNTNDINRFISLNPNSVFILDDFETQDYNSTKIISSIIHLVDGFKSDIYNCSFIICCNEEIGNDNIFDSNNTHGIIEVGSLDPSKAKSLRKLLKLKDVKNDLRLISVIREEKTVETKNPGY